MSKIVAAAFGVAALILVAVLLNFRQGAFSNVPGGLDEMDAPALFARTCAQCHGQRGEGVVNLTQPLRGRALPTDRIKAQVQKGGQKMPALPFIQGETLERLARYVSGLK